MLEEIQQRLRFLDEVGLDYLTLDRLTSTLSGGEAQRIQLATSLGSHLVGALYVLDEPSIGLHPRDTHRLIEILKGLRDLGNTLLVVEHDPDLILAADHILDLGPGAGEHGGELVFAGTRAELLRDPESLTGRYLRGDARIALPARRRKTARQIPEAYGRAQPQLARRRRDDPAWDCWWRSPAFRGRENRRWCTTCCTRPSKPSAWAGTGASIATGSRATCCCRRWRWSISRPSGGRRDRIRRRT